MKLSDWIGLVCFVIALVMIWQFRAVLLLVFAAVVLTIALNSLVRRFMNTFHLRRSRAVLATLGLVFLGLTIFIVLVLPLFVGQFEQLLQLVPEGLNRLDSWLARTLENPPRWWIDTNAEFNLPEPSELIEQFATFGSQFFGNFVSFFSGSVATLLQLLLLVVLTLMFLSDPHAYRNLLLRLFPSFYRRRADEILSKCEQALLCWLGGVSINALFVATLSFVGLVLLRVPYPFANAVLAGLFNFIPNIGPALSAIFPIIVALSQTFGSAIAVLILYIFIQNLESYWFSPMMMQKRVALLPAATLIVQIFFAKFLGLLGLILALPLAVVCKTWIEEAWIVDFLEKNRSSTRIDGGHPRLSINPPHADEKES
ncbi:AI-2E family transporter [Oscillatoria sp. CS-180]|uniref:AI-2E family transporter n=1 Tax=Oscillatoria sp. CS-180 TaxID=3021720 RepID=UPI00232D84EC|nr:AI-2E family transporter [Oscillatoria sp. CS-180]MDB9528932.1 AI-2E family transporter [Oscillatoria sp. CS-180]